MLKSNLSGPCVCCRTPSPVSSRPVVLSYRPRPRTLLFERLITCNHGSHCVSCARNTCTRLAGAPLDPLLSGHRASSREASDLAALQERCLEGTVRNPTASCSDAGSDFWRSGAPLAPRCRSKLEAGLDRYRLKYIDTGSATPIYHVLGYGFIFAYAVAWPQVRPSCLIARGR